VKDALIVAALSLAPRRTGARGMGWFARTRASRWVTRAFVASYGVDLSEATGELGDYPTLEALFTRSLRDGVRPIDPDPAALVSPVDGRCACVATTVDGRIDVVPGKALDLAQLLGRPLHAEVDVVVLYLSPKDYHRVHVPREGTARRWSYVPGTLWPVFPAAVRRVANLFARNERCVVDVESAGGPLEIVLVGAFGVGRITLEIADVVSNSGGAARSEALDPPLHLERGALLGTFHLGSTVILVAPPGRWAWTVRAGEVVRLGAAIGRLAEQ
jgi:phosphatidylserine decarboxylase